MKILFVANKAEFGGAPKCMLELIEQLIRNYGVEIEVVTSGNGAIAKWCDERNVKHYAVGHVPFAIGKGSTPFRRIAKTILTPYYFLKSYISNQKAFRKACDVIDFQGIDIIHTNSNRDCLGAMLARKYGKPHIWHLREFGKEDYDIRYLMPNYIKFMNSTTEYFVTISDAVKFTWIKKGIASNKVVRIYDGIRMPSQDVVDKASAFQVQRDGKTLKFAYLGIVCPGKGQFDAVKALSYLDREVTKHIQIDFWGDCNCLPEFTDKIIKFARQNGILESITFKGFTDNIWAELPNYDAALVCSRSEAFGRITPEYMSIGLQVIVSDTGANPELVEDGISGYVYKHDDLRDLASKIELIYRMDKEQKKIVSERAKSRAGKYTDENHAKNIYDFYKTISK